jgi:large subunit ribosomal protein L9
MSQVKLILRDDVPRLGDAGDVVSVKPGYARNYLLPRGLAIPASDARVKELEHHRHIIAEKRAAELSDLQGAAEKIGNTPLSVTVQAGDEGKLFGSVTAQHVADMLAEKGFDVDRRKIVLHDPIKQVGSYEIEMKLRSDVTATIKLSVVSSTPVVVAAVPDTEDGEEIRFGGAEEDHHGPEDDD